MNRPDYGWRGAQMVEPYVTERVTWAIRYHQALRYFADSFVGYEYPEMYVPMFGKNYKPAAYIEVAYQEALAHRWYLTARHFKQPAEGLATTTAQRRTCGARLLVRVSCFNARIFLARPLHILLDQVGF